MPCADNGESSYYAEQKRLSDKHGSETAQVACELIKHYLGKDLPLPSSCVLNWWAEHQIEDQKKAKWEEHNPQPPDCPICPVCKTIMRRNSLHYWECQC